MSGLRHLIHRRSGLAGWLLAVTLLVRLLLPAGYMIGATPGGAVAITLCPADGPMPMTAPMAMPGMAHHHDPASNHADQPCAFAGLHLASLGGGEPLPQVATIVLPEMPRAPLAQPRAPPASLAVRPPSRGPPIA